MSAAPTRGSSAERKSRPSTSSDSHSEPSSHARRRKLRVVGGGAEVSMAPGRAPVLKAEARPHVQRPDAVGAGERPGAQQALLGEGGQAMDDGQLWLKGAWVDTPETAPVHAPWDGRLLGRVA